MFWLWVALPFAALGFAVGKFVREWRQQRRDIAVYAAGFLAARAERDSVAFAVPPAAEVTDEWGGAA